MKFNQLKVAASVIGIIIMARCLPHLANFSPLIGLVLLAPIALSARYVGLYCAAALVLTDGVLAILTHQAWLGSWTIWTYSGFMGIWLMGRCWPQLGRQWVSSLFAGLVASVGYWGWTNIGVWVSSGIYPHTDTGLVSCFLAALPFLSRSALGTLVIITGYVACRLYTRRVSVYV